MECGGDLDDGLQKAFLRLFEFEPDGFPIFVGFKELSSPVACEACSERRRGPVEGAHRGQFIAWRALKSIAGDCREGNGGKNGAGARKRAGEDSGLRSPEKGDLLLSDEFKTAMKNSPRTASDEFLWLSSGAVALQEHEFLLGFFGLVEKGFQLFAGVTTAVMMSKCRGNNPPQMFFPALKM